MKRISVFLISIVACSFLPISYQVGWICENPDCREENDCDQSEGCQKCREEEERIQRLNEEYLQDIAG